MLPSRKVIVAGSRDFKYPKLMDMVLSDLHKHHFHFSELIHGDQGVVKDGVLISGADKFAGQWGKANGIPVTAYPADWKKWPKGAGAIRNKEMGSVGETLVAFWNGGKSNGTAGMTEIAREFGLGILVVQYNEKGEVVKYSNDVIPRV